METGLEDIKQRVAALLRLAEDQANPHESALAAAKASELLLKWNLSKQEVLVAEGRGDEGPAIEQIAYNLDGSARLGWVTLLAEGVAKGNLCEALFGKRSVWFCGTPDNIEIAGFVFGELYNILGLAADREARKRRKQNRAAGVQNIGGSAFRISWLEGAASIIVQRLRHTVEEFKVARTGLELVIVHEDAIKNYMDAFFAGRKRKAFAPKRGAHLFDLGAFQAGVDYGRDMVIPKHGSRLLGSEEGGD